jgi:hypothetical protein
MSDDLELKVKRLIPGEYESYDLPFRAQVVQAVVDVFVDDLRNDDDDSLNLVPRITTFEQLKNTFKIDIDHTLGRDAAKPGEFYWAVIGFYLRTGTAAFIPKVLDQNEQPPPPPGVFVFAHWPGAPSIDANPKYHPNAVGGFTNVNGDIGFGYSGGAVTGGGGGVYDIWVSSDPPTGTRFYSDMAVRLGWWGGTDHLTPNPIFKAVKKGGEVLPPIDGDAELRVFDQSGSFVGRVALSNGVGSGGRIALFSGDTEQAYVELE